MVILIFIGFCIFQILDLMRVANQRFMIQEYSSKERHKRQLFDL